MTEEPAHKASNDGSDGSEPTHSPDGVDLTLIRWMLSLTPEERLEVLESQVNDLLRLRDDNPGA